MKFSAKVRHDNIESQKKLRLYTVSRRYIFGKITGVGG